MVSKISNHIKEQLNKFDFFKKCIYIEIGSNNGHFLRIKVTKQFLEGIEPKPDPELNGEQRNKSYIRLGIWKFYQVFDRGMYETILTKHTTPIAITSNVWARYREIKKIEIDKINKSKYPNQYFDSTPKQFKKIDNYGEYKLTINLAVNSIYGIIDSLIQLASHPNSETLIVSTKKVESNDQTTYIYYNDIVTPSNVIPKHNKQNENKRVIGMLISNDSYYIVTKEIKKVLFVYHKKVSACESSYTKVVGFMNVLHEIDSSISNLKVTRVHLGKKIVMNINITYGGRDNVDATTIFESHFIRNLKDKENQQLKVKSVKSVKWVDKL
jgi:hypothetical protein